MKHKIFTLALALVMTTSLFAAQQSGKIGPNARWKYDTSTKEFRISGTGTTYDGTYTYNAMYQAAPKRANAPQAKNDNPSGVITFQYGAAKSGDAYTFDAANVQKIVVEEGITSLGEWTCAFFTNAKTVQLPSTLKKIGGGSFLNNTSLTQVTIPVNVDTMKVAVCKSLASMYGSDIPMGAFHGCTGLKTIYWNARGNTDDQIVQPLEGLESILTKIVLGTTVVHIPEKICVDFTKITGELRLEKNIKTIGYAAFAGCKQINKITLLADSMATQPTLFWNSYYYQSIYTNHHGAPFAMCSKNMEIFIGKDVKYIGQFVFSNYDKSGKMVGGNTPTYTISKHNYVDTIRVTFEEGSTLKVIDSYAFAGVNGLANFTLPESVQSIMPSAFFNTDLTSVTIPENTTQIGTNAFASCASLSSIQYNARNAYVLTNGTNTSSGWEYLYKSPFLNCAPSVSVTIGENVQILPSFMFSAGVRREVYNNGWRSSYSTGQRSDITSVTIEEGSQLYRIESYAFEGCTAIPTMTIPENVSWIRDSAFFQCTGIDTFHVQRNYPASLGNQTFPANAKIKVKCVARDSYVNNSDWNVYNIVSECSGYMPYYTVKFYQTYPQTTLLKSIQVTTGETPTYTGPTPTRASTAQYDYTFSRWFSYDKNGNIIYGLQPVWSDQAYYAEYTETLRKYTVQFVDWNGNIIASQEVPYGGSATSPANPTREGYTFIGWDTDFSNISSNITVKAVYEKIPVYYTITFLDGEDSVLQTSQVLEGEMPVYTGETPYRPADQKYTYTFIGWYPELAVVTGDAEYMAMFSLTLNKYTITFKDEDGSILSSDQWEYGTKPTCEIPTKEEDEQYRYLFAKWIPDVIPVEGDAIYTASYTAIQIDQANENIYIDTETARKILLNGQILILRGNRTYTLTGQEVK